MPPFSRGFRGRRVDVDPGRVPPGQYVTPAPIAWRLAGQHVDVRLTGEDGYQAQRSYSIQEGAG
jgi:hypothetical protein